VNWSLDLSVDYSDIDQDGFWGDGEDSYLDWSVTLGTSFGGVDVALVYVDNDLDEDVVGDIVEARGALDIQELLSPNKLRLATVHSPCMGPLRPLFLLAALRVP
jgi:hypothetical protein